MPPLEGDAIARLVIPKANVDKIVVEGVGVEDLKKAPGHYPGTPMPGEPGNSAIAGHRTTYGAPFYDLSDLVAGDTITVTTRVGEFRYEVDNLQVVSPDAVEVLDPTEDNRLTLTTCNPRYSAAERLIVSAKLVTAPVTPPPPPEGTVEPPTELAADGLAGLSGDRAARGPAVGWGILCAAIWLATWWLSRLWDRGGWPTSSARRSSWAPCSSSSRTSPASSRRTSDRAELHWSEEPEHSAPHSERAQDYEPRTKLAGEHEDVHEPPDALGTLVVASLPVDVATEMFGCLRTGGRMAADIVHRLPSFGRAEDRRVGPSHLTPGLAHRPGS